MLFHFLSISSTVIYYNRGGTKTPKSLLRAGRSQWHIPSIGASTHKVHISSVSRGIRRQRLDTARQRKAKACFLAQHLFRRALELQSSCGAQYLVIARHGDSHFIYDKRGTLSETVGRSLDAAALVSIRSFGLICWTMSVLARCGKLNNCRLKFPKPAGRYRSSYYAKMTVQWSLRDCDVAHTSHQAARRLVEL